jgi:hypothetical protein
MGKSIHRKDILTIIIAIGAISLLFFTFKESGLDAEISSLIVFFILKLILLAFSCLVFNLKIDVREPIFILALIDAIFFGGAYFVLYFFFQDTKVFDRLYFQPSYVFHSFIINTIGWVIFVIGYLSRSTYRSSFPLFINKKILRRFVNRSLIVGGSFPLSNYYKAERFVALYLSTGLILNVGIFLSRGSLRGSGSLPTSFAFLLSLVDNSNIFLIALSAVITARMNLSKNSRHIRSILLTSIVIFVITSTRLLTSTSKEDAIIPVIIFLLTWFLMTKKLLVKTLAIALGIYLVFAPINSYLRYDPIVSAKQTIELSDYIRIGSDLFQGKSNETRPLVEDYAQLFARLDLVSMSSTLIEQVDRGAISTTDGASFMIFFNSLLPRLVFPNKPISTDLYDPNYLGRKTRVISPNDFATSIAYGAVAELYLNFKMPAVILGMFSLGYLFRSFYDLIVQGEDLSDFSIILLSFPLYGFFRSYTSSFSALAGIIPTTIFATLLIALLTAFLPTSSNQRESI